MPNLLMKDFAYLKMWPRELFSKKHGARLLIREEVEEMEFPGIYILYKDEDPFYVGRANRLVSRLHSHANKITSKHYQFWTHFSAFALNPKVKDRAQKLALLEAVLIAAMPKARNGSTPRFKRVQIPKSMRLL